MKNKGKKATKPASAQRPGISPPKDPVTEPSTYIEARMINKDQLENFLKDVWDESIRKRWWDHVERFLIGIASFCVPYLYSSLSQILSEPEIKIEAFGVARFWMPAAGVVGGIALYIILQIVRSYRTADHDKKHFIARWMNAFPMTSGVAVPYSSFKPLNPSVAEPEQK